MAGKLLSDSVRICILFVHFIDGHDEWYIGMTSVANSFYSLWFDAVVSCNYENH